MKITSKDRALIDKHFRSDLSELAFLLQHEDCDVSLIINQIKAKRKAKEKIPSWYANDQLIYPNYISLEQCSSEWTAKRKAKLFPKGKILDLTGGMGVDAYFISEHVDSYELLERQEYLCAINKHNFKELGRTNIEVNNLDSIQYFENNKSKFTAIYLDPARRNDDETRRVFFLEDFSPNIVELQSKLWEHSNHIVVKLAPMLDINSVVKSLDYVSNIYVLSWKNEVKELIVELRKGSTSYNRHAINILGVSMEEDAFSMKNGVKVTLAQSKYSQYIYEPNKAILKAQLQDQAARHYNLMKMNNNTHFYTSEDLVLDFPGRVFKVLKKLPGKEKSFRKEFSGDQANIISRNHPLKSADLHKRFSLRSGGKAYILAFTGMNDKRYLLGVERLK